MALRCKTCGAENPAINRYCGQCGEKLDQSATESPEMFCRNAAADPVEHHSVEPLEASANLPPEVIDFDNQIPLFAGEGSDRRIHTPPEVVEQLRDHLELEAELHDHLRHGSEPHYEVRAKQEAERDDFLHWKINHFDEKAFFPDAATDEATAAPPLSNHDFLPEGETSEPSFLGLSDDRVPRDDYGELEPKPHLRHNVALVVLAGVVVLAAVQWRSIRDRGLAFVQKGPMASRKEVFRNPPAGSADKINRDLGLGLDSSKAGSPQAGGSSRALDAQSAATARQPVPPTPGAPAMHTNRPPAMSAPAPDVPRNIQSASPAPTSRHTAKPRQFRAPPPARSVARAAPVAGVDEMNRAAHASDAEARAAWLWRAVAKGNPQAPVELAKMYEQGNGVVRSCDQAQVLLRSGAAKGNAQAKLNLKQIRIRGGCSAR
jgi:hypothetical protein